MHGNTILNKTVVLKIMFFYFLDIDGLIKISMVYDVRWVINL